MTKWWLPAATLFQGPLLLRPDDQTAVPELHPARLAGVPQPQHDGETNFQALSASRPVWSAFARWDNSMCTR